MLPNFPLCLEWLDFPPASSSSSPSVAVPNNSGFGNYIAVGTLDPEIEIWSLDVLEAMYPASILGRPDETKAHVPVPSGTGKKKKKKPKHRTSQASYHVDAVLGLSWNKHQRNLLASASADRTVKLWDLSRDPTMNGEGGESGGAIRSFDIHKDKVQAVQWNDQEPTVLLTGSYDRTVRTFDSRAPTTGVGAIVGSDVEALRWDPWENYGFYVSLFLFEENTLLNFHRRYLGLVRKWPRAKLRRPNTSFQPRSTLTFPIHPTSSRWSCVLDRREPTLERVHCHRWHGQVSQSLEHQRRGERQAECQPSHISRPRSCMSFLLYPQKFCFETDTIFLICRGKSSRQSGHPTTLSHSQQLGQKPNYKSGTSVPTLASAKLSVPSCGKLERRSRRRKRVKAVVSLVWQAMTKRVMRVMRIRLQSLVVVLLST